MISTVLVAVWLAGPSIASNSTCPSARAIEDNLRVLLPMESAPPGTARVVGLPESLLVDLRPDNSAASAQRSVAVEGDCDDRARTAAVLIATWWPTEPGGQLRLDAAAPAPHPGNRVRLGVSAGIFASALLDSLAPGAHAEVSLSRQRLGFRLSLAGTGSHGGRLGRGKVEWQRLAAESGPTYGTGHFRLDAGFVASALFIQGSGFTESQSSSGASLGATTGLRVAWEWKGVHPWLELRGIYWPKSQRIYVLDRDTALETSRPMPHGEIQFAAGVAFSL